MFARYVAGDAGGPGGVRHAGTEKYADPEWETVRSLVEALDGRVRTYVMLSPTPPEQGDEHMLVIRAARKGMYVCEMFDGEQHLLVNPAGVPLAEPLLEGEFAFHSTREFVDLDAALSAARAYYETGGLDHGLSWEKV